MLTLIPSLLLLALPATALGAPAEMGRPGVVRPSANKDRTPTASQPRANKATKGTATPARGTGPAGPATKRMSKSKLGKARSLRLQDVCTGNETFNIGRGVHDITGPAAEAQTLGYANSDQQTAGIDMRLWSRAFVIESPCNGKRVVLVTADLGMVYQSVKQGVVDRLKTKYGSTYSNANVLIAATHTHQGPAGFSYYALYNATGFENPIKQGFDPDNYKVIVDGIVASIERAHGNVRSGKIRLQQGALTNASKNRSVAAYARNADRGRYTANVDRDMTLLRLDAANGTALGQINWFAVHPTNYSKSHKRITGDNKGIAAWRFERDHGTDYRSSDTFVAAFANANEGDVSPNLWGIPDGTHDAQRAHTIGGRQYSKAKSLYGKSGGVLRGGVDYRHRHANFSNMTVAGEFTGAGTQKTCPAALGIAFAAGSTEDGPSGSEVLGVTPHEGMVYTGKNRVVLPGTPKAWLTQLQSCHAEKDVLFPIGKKNWLGNPYPWTPEVLPIQLVRVGSLAIAAVPFECTTMCGRRIRKTILSELAGQGVTDVVIGGLANAYAGYVATRQEYALQHYEGASTHFGPWTLAALRSQFSLLARAMRRRKDVSAGPSPRRLGDHQIEIPDGVVFDDKPLGKDFGDLHKQPNASYAKGHTVRAVFWSGHPKNGYRTQSGYATIERRVGNSWKVVARDWDANTSYRWKRHGAANSRVTIDWSIPGNAASGTYRIRHRGRYKNGWDGSLNNYSGTSRTFTVQ